jgi:hypothetical protein
MGVYQLRWSQITGGRRRLTHYPGVREFRAALRREQIFTEEQYHAAQKAGRLLEFPGAPLSAYKVAWSALRPKRVYPPKTAFQNFIKEQKLTQPAYSAARRAGQFTEFPVNPIRVYDIRWPWKPERPERFPPREEFVARMRKDKVRNQLQYVHARREGRYQEFPGHPNAIYLCSWSSLFGMPERTKKQFWPIEKARAWVKRQRFEDIRAFEAASRPNKIPLAPQIIYGKQFRRLGGWSWWLGKKK